VSQHVFFSVSGSPLSRPSGPTYRYGRGALSASALLESANSALSILPIRLAHRLQALRNLPFIVVTNPHVLQIHNNYLHAVSSLIPFAERQIDTLEDEIKFTEVMAGLVQKHFNTIPILARGFLESRKYISPQTVTRFLDEHLRARIGTRLIAEQYIALHHSSQQHVESNSDTSSALPHDSSLIGIVDTALQPAAVIRSCAAFVSEICELNYGVRPTIVIKGEPNTTIAHVPMHLEYIITELLKNAFRATVENGHDLNPVEVTIAPTSEEPELTGDNDPFNGNAAGQSASESIAPLEKASSRVTIRIRDRGGGISPDNFPNLWTYGFTTFNEHEASNATRPGTGLEALNIISGSGGGGSTLAGLGYGLPLGRAYAEYFGGGIAIQSLWGWGTDVYLTLRGVEKIAGRWL